MDCIRRNFFTKQFMTFIVIGMINTLNGSVIAFGYSRILQANLAFVLGYMSALVIAYFLNSYLTFKVRPCFVVFLRFAASYIPNFIVQNAVVFVVYNVLNLNELIAYILAAIIGIPITFLILKWFAFGQKSAESK